MLLATGPRRATKPGADTDINWSHPLTSGLVGYWLFSEGGPASPLDLVSKYKVDPQGGLTIDAGPAGFGAGTTTNKYFLSAANIAAFNVATTSVFARVRSTASTDGQTICSIKNDGSRQPLIFSIKDATFNLFSGYSYLNGGSWNQSGVVTNISGDNKVHDVVGTSTVTLAAVGTLSYYVDGRLDSTGAGDPYLPGTGEWQIGVRNTASTDWFYGQIFHVGVYNRALSASEARWISEEPYALLRPLIRRRYFIAAPVVAPPPTPTGGLHERLIGRGIARGVQR